MNLNYENQELRAEANQLLRSKNHESTCNCEECREEKIRMVIDFQSENRALKDERIQCRPEIERGNGSENQSL